MSWLIKIQADDFLHAYQILKESKVPVVSPAVVCLAFSVELYIKYLHFTVKNEVPRGHNILKLFEMLPEAIKQEIFSHDSISKNPFATRGDVFLPKRYASAYNPYDGFIDQIKAISAGFEKWRYSYESVTLRYDEWFALAFIEALKSVSNKCETTMQNC